MIYEEDIIKIPYHKKIRIEKHPSREYHHTRQGGRTDHSTSSHGLRHTDRVMEILQTWVFVIRYGECVKGYMGIHQRDRKS